MTSASDEYLTLAEVAAILKKSVPAVRCMIDRGQLPGVRRPRPRMVRVSKRELTAWLDAA